MMNLHLNCHQLKENEYYSKVVIYLWTYGKMVLLFLHFELLLHEKIHNHYLDISYVMTSRIDVDSVFQ